MTRPVLYLAFVLFLAVSAPAHAQQLAPVPPPFAGIDPLESKDLAKAKRAALQADVQKLKRSQLEATRTECEERAREFLAGREMLETFQDSIARLLESELALHEKADERLACIESIWLIRLQTEEVNRARAEAGRIPTKQYFETKYHRLNAERAMIQARAKWNKQATRISLQLVNSIFLEKRQGFAEISLLDVKESAKAKHAALRADPKNLLRSMSWLIRWALESREKEFLAGRGTLDIMLEMMGRVRDTSLLLAVEETDRCAHLEEYWMMVKQVEDVNKIRHAVERIPIQDLMQPLRFGFDAEIALIEAWRKKETKYTPAFPLATNLIFSDDFTGKEMARKKYMALHVDPEKLRHERLDAARVECAARFEEFLAGRGTLDILISAAGRLLEDDLALATNSPQRWAARERHWARMVLIHEVNGARFKARRIPPQDYAQAAFFLAEAEMALKKQLGK